MTNTPTTNLIEARALKAPGYMELDSARHIFLISEDRKIGWPCFGRGYNENDKGELLSTSPIYTKWACNLAGSNTDIQYLAGVANTVNGTCHTIANRILALSDEDHDVSASIDDPYSVVVFGKYGFGTSQFCALLAQSFEQVRQEEGLPTELLARVQKRVQTPFANELDAWKKVIHEQFNLDVQALLNSSPVLEKNALATITAYSHDRDNMYEACFDYRQNRAPSEAEKAQLFTELKKLVLNYVKQILHALTVAHIITSDQQNAFEQNIQKYIEKFHF